MKRLVTTTTLVAFGLMPFAASACDAYDEAMATATPPAALASAPPAASKVPAATVAKTPAKVTKVANKVDAKPTETKVAATTAN